MRATPPGTTFSRADALGAGWSDSALARAVAAGRIARVRRGHFTALPESTPEIAAIAASRACRGSVVSHRSALLMHGLPLIGTRPPVPELTVPPLRRVDVPAAHVHRASLPPEHLVMSGDFPITSVARTLVDVGRSRPTSVAVAAMDHALHEQMVTADEIYEVIRSCWNWPGIRRAARALRLADERAESPLESVSRLVLRRLGLPTPELQAVVLDRFGHFAARLDFYWDEWGVAGEADGRMKYDSRTALVAEKYRQEKLEDHTMVFVRWGWDDALHRPRLLKTRLEAGFARGRARDRSGLTRLWSVSRA